MGIKIARETRNVNTIGKDVINGKKVERLNEIQFRQELEEANKFHLANGFMLEDNEFEIIIANNGQMVERIDIGKRERFKQSDFIDVYMISFKRDKLFKIESDTQTVFYLKDEIKTFRAKGIEELMQIVNYLKLLWYEEYAAETGANVYEIYKQRQLALQD